ncbi:MAG: hypothetical protein ACOYOB_19680, partial [Myxococcota bacterium]
MSNTLSLLVNVLRCLTRAALYSAGAALALLVAFAFAVANYLGMSLTFEQLGPESVLLAMDTLLGGVLGGV